MGEEPRLFTTENSVNGLGVPCRIAHDVGVGDGAADQYTADVTLPRNGSAVAARAGARLRFRGFAPGEFVMTHEWRRGSFRISTDPSLLDHDLIHGFLSSSYWAKGIPAETVRRSIEHSIPFGVFDGERQVGFARVITDCATFAYLGDVFVIDEYRGRGLSKWLMEAVVSHPDLQGMRRWVLLTRDAHGLYRQFGFTDVQNPDRYMEKWDPEIYRRP